MSAAQEIGSTELPAPGLHPAYPSELYHQRKLGVVSKSALDLVRRSPAHYRAWIDGALPDDETPALTFGRAFHCALLEPETFARRYTVQPDFGDCRFKENKLSRDQWRAANAQREALAPDTAQAISGMVEAVQAHPLAGKMIRDGDPELTLTWKDPDTGLTCKIRMDYYVRKLGMIVDAKSTDDASPDAFRRSIAKYGYHRQDALYRAGCLEIGAPVQHFVLIAVEKTAPHAVAIYSLDSEAVGKGYVSVRRDIDRLAECVRTNNFPGYPPGINELDLPPWVD
jgi:hypothetical protein